MPILVYNLTAAPLTLPNGHNTVIPANTLGVDVRGGKPWTSSGNELQGLTDLQYATLQDLQQSLVNGTLLLGSLTAVDVDVPMIPTVILGANVVNINGALPQSGYMKIDSEYLHWSSSFYGQNSLTVALAPADVTATFSSTAAFAATGFALVSTSGGNELISWSGKTATQLTGLLRNQRGTSNGGATAAIGTLVIANYVSGVTRGQLGSVAAVHADAAAVVIEPFVNFEWSNGLPEYYVGSLVVQAVSNDFPQDDTQTFADVATGLDTNPGTQAAPVKSLKRLYNLVPGNWRKSNVAYLSSAVYSVDEFGAPFLVGGAVGVGSTPIAIVGGAPTLVAGPFIVGAINADSSIEVGGAFVADVFFGGAPAGQANAIRVLSGPLKGQTRMCAGNTTTALLPRNPLTGIQVGDAVQIETRSTTIQISAGVNYGFGANCPLVGYKGIKFQCLAGAIGVFVADLGNVAMEACTIDLTTAGALNVNRGSTLYTNPNPWGNMLTNNPFSGLRADGVFIDSRAAAFTMVVADQARFNATALVRNLDVLMSTGASSNGAFTHARTSSIHTAFLNQFVATGVSATAFAYWLGKHSTALAAFQFANGTQFALDNMMILGSANAVMCGNHIATASNVGAALGATGSLGNVRGNTTTDVALAAAYVPAIAANTGVGIKYTNGSRVDIDAGGALTTVSGTGGDTQGTRVGADTQTYATVRTADGSGIKGYQDPYLNRIEPTLNP